MSLQSFLDQIVIQLRHYREARGISQVEAASLLRVGTRSYQRYEAGESIPTIDILYELAGILNFDLKDLFNPLKTAMLVPGFTIVEDSAGMNGAQLSLYPLELLDTNAMKETLQHGDLKRIKYADAFKNSKLPLAFSTPRQTILNLAAREALGIDNDLIPTHHLTGDIAQMGVIWGALIQRDNKIANFKTSIETLKGKLEINSLSIFITGKEQYYLLRNLEIKNATI